MNKKTKNILIILFIAIYSPIASEFILRAVDFVPMLPRYVCAMSYGIRGNEPNKSYWHQTAEYKINIQTNSKGMRCPYDIQYEKKPGVKRIVLLGDSFGMGYGVSYEQMFTSRLAYYLKEKGIAVEIVNLSTSGHGNAEELIVLQEEGIKYHPDLVLLSWHSTDFDDNIRSGLFKLVDGKLEGDSKTFLPGVATREKLFKYSVYRFLAENSNFYNFFRDWAGSTIKSWMAKSKSKKTAANNENTNSSNEKEKLTIAILNRIKQIAKKNNAEFLILDIPVRHSRKVFISTFPYEYLPKDSTFHIFSPINLFSNGNGEKIYWEKSHGHFTPLGCNMVGNALKNYIVDHHLLK